MPDSTPAPAGVCSRMWRCVVAPVVLEGFCGCLSLRGGVLVIAVLSLVNASLAFAGEAALYAGLLTAIGEQAQGKYLPPGTKIDSPAVHSGLIVVGVYTLIASIAAFVSALRRSLCATTLLYVQQVVDLVLAISIVTITWLGGGSIGSVLAQIPVLLLNYYFVLVIRSFRTVLLAERAAGALAERVGASSDGGGGGGALGGDENDDDDDIDIELGVDAGSSTGSSKAKPPTLAAPAAEASAHAEAAEAEAPPPAVAKPKRIAAPKGAKGV